MTTSVEIQHVSFAYGRGAPVLRDISLAVETGTFLVVVGPNGAGKSTLVNLIAGLLVPDSGAIRVDGKDVRSYRPKDRARKIALVHQEFVPIFGLSAAEAVLMARTAHYGPAGFESETDRQLAAMALELTDTARFATRPLGSLSGGERQRVFIARALAQDTPILLMDEPTSFLDLKHQVATYDLLKTIQAEKSRTIIAVTHEINLAAQYCDEALLLRPAYAGPGHYRVGPTREVFTAENVSQTFGVGVFSGVVGMEKFFLPLGKTAKDAKHACRRYPESAPSSHENHSK